MFPSLCGLIQFQGEVRKKVLSQLLLLLCHSFPVVGLLGACTAILEAGLLGFFDQQFHPGGKISMKKKERSQHLITVHSALFMFFVYL